jgi:hypothetical protein
MKLLIMQFSPASRHFLQIFLFSDTLTLCSSLTLRDQVSYSNKITGNFKTQCPKQNTGTLDGVALSVIDKCKLVKFSN